MQLAMIFDKGSITAAAQQLLLTQPTLTRNMNTLEMQAGGSLFQRSRFGVRSTPLGDNLARIGRSIARQMQSADEAVSRHRIGLNTQLRVATGPLIGMALVPQLSESVLRDRPKLAITVTTGRPLALVDQLVDGDHDAVIAPAVYAQTPRGIERTLLSEDEISIFCGPGHPLAQRPQPTAEELSEADWMNVGTTSPFQNAELEMLERSGIRRLRTQFATVSDAVILLQVLMRGRHLAVLPRLPVQLLASSYPLVELSPPAGPSRRDLHIWFKSELAENTDLMHLIAVAHELVQCVRPLRPVALTRKRKV